MPEWVLTDHGWSNAPGAVPAKLVPSPEQIARATEQASPWNELRAQLDGLRMRVEALEDYVTRNTVPEQPVMVPEGARVQGKPGEIVTTKGKA